jgi:hypothetical protein
MVKFSLQRKRQGTRGCLLRKHLQIHLAWDGTSFKDLASYGCVLPMVVHGAEECMYEDPVVEMIFVQAAFQEFTDIQWIFLIVTPESERTSHYPSKVESAELTTTVGSEMAATGRYPSLEFLAKSSLNVFQPPRGWRKSPKL